MKIDLIECVIGSQPFPLKLKSGDVLDSQMQLFSGPRRLYTAEYCNTDPTVSWHDKGGRLAEGEYRFICDRRKDNGKKVLYLYRATPDEDRGIVLAQDLTDIMRTLPSLIPNPAHKGKNIMTNILVHSVGVYTDGSQGCISASEFNRFISYFYIGDKGRFILRRDPAWQEPDYYKAG